MAVFALLGPPLSPAPEIKSVFEDITTVWNPVGGEDQWEKYEAVFIFSGSDPDTVTPETVCGWIGHPHLRVIFGASAEEELTALRAELCAALSDEECERKFLVTYPSLASLDASPFVSRVHIIQTYLTAEEGVTERVRYRERNGEVIYTHTKKKRINAISCEEVEQTVDRRTYEAYLERTDHSRRPIEKTRYCILHHGLYFELDVYPFWTDRAVVELELAVPCEGALPFPDAFRVIKEVTDDLRYKNVSLAKEVPYDPIN